VLGWNSLVTAERIPLGYVRTSYWGSSGRRFRVKFLPRENHVNERRDLFHWGFIEMELSRFNRGFSAFPPEGVCIGPYGFRLVEPIDLQLRKTELPIPNSIASQLPNFAASILLPFASNLTLGLVKLPILTPNGSFKVKKRLKFN
jgi:hypothetical protein